MPYIYSSPWQEGANALAGVSQGIGEAFLKRPLYKLQGQQMAIENAMNMARIPYIQAQAENERAQLPYWTARTEYEKAQTEKTRGETAELTKDLDAAKALGALGQSIQTGQVNPDVTAKGFESAAFFARKNPEQFAKWLESVITIAQSGVATNPALAQANLLGGVEKTGVTLGANQAFFRDGLPVAAGPSILGPGDQLFGARTMQYSPVPAPGTMGPPAPPVYANQTLAPIATNPIKPAGLDRTTLQQLGNVLKFVGENEYDPTSPLVGSGKNVAKQLLDSIQGILKQSNNEGMLSQPGMTKENPVTIPNDEAAYNNLPSGTYFRDPRNPAITRRKP